MKFKSILVTSLVVASIATSASAYAENNVSIVLNGKDMEYTIAPIIVNDRTLVSADELLQQYHIPYTWHNDSKKIEIESPNNEIIELAVDTNIMLSKTNDSTEAIYLDARATMIDNKLFIPLRAVSEALGYTVDWYDEYESASVKTISIEKGVTRLEEYVRFLNLSKNEIKENMETFELYTSNLAPFYLYSGSDTNGNNYVFGFMDAIDKCCFVETTIKNVFPDLKKYYEVYESIDKSNMERYIDSSTVKKVDNFTGYYLEYPYKDFSVRISCNDDGSTGYVAGLYVTQNEPSFLEFIEKNFPVHEK